MDTTAATKDGRLTVSLFHGTSSLFYDGIRSSGLGGRNVVEDMGLRTAARLLLELCAPWQHLDEWLLEFNGCANIAREPSFEVFTSLIGFSFRYGGTFVSASRDTAVNYALLYKDGSEALSQVLKLHKLLASVRPDLADRDEFNAIVAFATAPAKRLLVEAVDVEVSSLRAENGSEYETVIPEIEYALSDPDFYHCLVQQANFELIHPVTPAQLRFHQVLTVTEPDEWEKPQERTVIVPWLPAKD